MSVESLLGTVMGLTTNILAVNAAGVPATAQPIPLPGSHVPASLQLIGPLRSEEMLLPTAAHVEAGVHR